MFQIDRAYCIVWIWEIAAFPSYNNLHSASNKFAILRWTEPKILQQKSGHNFNIGFTSSWNSCGEKKSIESQRSMEWLYWGKCLKTFCVLIIIGAGCKPICGNCRWLRNLAALLSRIDKIKFNLIFYLWAPKVLSFVILKPDLQYYLCILCCQYITGNLAM